ncbi:MAG TPA: RagB/SusD family nutrient uptake outer membrane protein [Chitinophagaceae bacterium]|nr:RagB/SusD family nutrient uptake outer membrane protein [Chitinophagaceae bacterium]
MKRIQYILLVCCVGLCSCKKVIDLYPQSNLNTGTYYSNLEEVKAALTGCYNGLQRALLNEWQLTELRTDNSKQGSPGSTASGNRDLSDLDMFIPSTSHQGIYQYWLATYNNIRNTNIVLQRLGVVYDPASGAISLQNIDIPILENDRKQLAGEAMFIRAHHYFNLVRLFGGVFLVHQPISPAEAKNINRSSADDIYKLIQADLSTAATFTSALKFNQIANADKGRATSWAAKALLAKVYLTLNRKADAITLLQDVINNSGYSLLPNYANVFSVTNEVNAEILFTVRYKAGGIGLGSPFANMFAPIGSGSAVVNGDGDGLNYPTADLDTATNGDGRKATLIGVYGTGSAAKLYVRKYLSTVVIPDDAENDWPVLRFADVLLMLAEAQGFTPNSISLISQVRQRAGLPALNPAVVNTVTLFEQALAHERRVEFAFENHRFFDLVRYNTTLSTITAEQVIKDHYADEYQTHYRLYTAPTPTLAQLQSYITREKLLLPIPQREIDNNTTLVIPQNPGY